MAKATIKTQAHIKKMPTKMPMGESSQRREQLRKTGQAPFKAVRPYEKK